VIFFSSYYYKGQKENAPKKRRRVVYDLNEKLINKNNIMKIKRIGLDFI